MINQKQNLYMVSYGDMDIDYLSRLISKEDQRIKLRQMELKLLIYFIKNANRVIDRLTLLADVWNYSSYFLKTNTLEAHVCELRKKLKVLRSPPSIITVPKVGYLFR